MNEELIQFTRDALAKNIARPEIAQALAQAGWPESDINSALKSFAEVTFPLPVPRPKPYLSAAQVFIYVVMFSALYDSCYHIGSLIFDMINKAFPDSLHNGYNYFTPNFEDSVRWAIAHLAVTFPLFFFTFHSVNKSLVANPEQRNSRPRKWLTYITLLIATLSLTCNFATLIYTVLAGGLTTPFLLKVLTVAAIAGSTFSYFLYDVRKGEKI